MKLTKERAACEALPVSYDDMENSIPCEDPECNCWEEFSRKFRSDMRAATEALAAVKEASFPVQVPSEGTITGVNLRGKHYPTNIQVCKDDDIDKIARDVINKST